MTLYSYCLRFDDGAAPNPYSGICTLVICKPVIRRTAKIGDWIVGLGGVRSPIGDISGKVVYAMLVTEKLSMQEYDSFCRGKLPGKIPDWNSNIFEEKVGDCIYDFSRPGSPRMRPGVHDEDNRRVDLGGESALLSDHWYYFGDSPVTLPDDLLPIVHRTQGHKSRSNAPYVDRFVAWVKALGLSPNQLHGEPQLKDEMMSDTQCRAKCSSRDLDEGLADEDSADAADRCS